MNGCRYQRDLREVNFKYPQKPHTFSLTMELGRDPWLGAGSRAQQHRAFHQKECPIILESIARWELVI